MEWNKINLQIIKEYDMKFIQFTPFFVESVSLLKQRDKLKALDLCCGCGQHALYLADNGFAATALDNDRQKIQWLEKYNSLNNKNDIECIVGDMKVLPFADGLFDAVLCSSALHHQIFHDVERTVCEVFRVLKSKGTFIFNFLSVQDDSYGIGNQIEYNTFIGSREGEEEVPHHYTTHKELNCLLNEFGKCTVKQNEYFMSYNNTVVSSRVFDVFTVK